MTDMDAATRLLEIEAIKQLKARYFRFMDTKDFDGLRTIFAADAEFDASCSLSIEPDTSGDWVHRGGDAIADFVKAAVEPLTTVHHGHCHEVEILSDTTARGVIAMEDQIWNADGSPMLHGMGHYHETYTKVDGAWRIQTSRISRLRVELG